MADPIPIGQGRRQRRRDPLPTSIRREDFYAYMPKHQYLFVPTRQLWPGSSINARLGRIDALPANVWLDQNRPVEAMTWEPGEPQIIEGRLATEGGYVQHPGSRCFNQYRPPTITPGNPDGAQFWIEHVRKLYPDDWEHIVQCCAQRVQAPHIKINHALVLGGAPRIGKDSLIAPLKFAVGAWNCQEISPGDLMETFNGYRKAVVLRISEARDLGEVNKFAFYEAMKVLAAAPPEVLRVNEKHLQEYYVANVLFPIITTNYKTDGMYLPADDGRHYVAWSPVQSPDEFGDGYFDGLWRRYADGGYEDVAAYLRDLDISEFNPKLPPPKTDAFRAIVNAQRPTEEGELADILEALGNPTVVTLKQIIGRAAGTEIWGWLVERKNRRSIGHRLEKIRYERLDHPTADQGLWKIAGERQVVYGRMDVPIPERFRAANGL